MEPITLRVPEEMADDLGEEAEELGYSSRSEYVRHILRNRSVIEPTTEAYSERTGSEYTEIEERIKELEAAVFDEDGAHGDEEPESIDAHPREHTTQTTVQGGDTEDSLLDEYRAFLDEGGERKRVVREQLVTLLDELRQRGPLETSDLKDVLEANVGDRYQSRKSMWESYHRHLKALPGFEKAGYGEWDFEGEEETRSQL